MTASTPAPDEWRTFEVVATARVTFEVCALSAAEAEAEVRGDHDHPSQVLDLIEIEETVKSEEYGHA